MKEFKAQQCVFVLFWVLCVWRGEVQGAPLVGPRTGVVGRLGAGCPPPRFFFLRSFPRSAALLFCARPHPHPLTLSPPRPATPPLQHQHRGRHPAGEGPVPRRPGTDPGLQHLPAQGKAKRERAAGGGGASGGGEREQGGAAAGGGYARPAPPRPLDPPPRPPFFFFSLSPFLSRRATKSRCPWRRRPPPSRPSSLTRPSTTSTRSR